MDSWIDTILVMGKYSRHIRSFEVVMADGALIRAEPLIGWNSFTKFGILYGYISDLHWVDYGSTL